MAASALIDTGAILAILDSRDPWHNLCKAVFRQLRMPLLTSEAVLNELFHFTNANRGAMEAAWKFVRSGAMVVGPIPDAELAQISLSLAPRLSWLLLSDVGPAALIMQGHCSDSTINTTMVPKSKRAHSPKMGLGKTMARRSAFTMMAK